MIENAAQFNELFNTLLNKGDVLRYQKESLERVWQAAWNLGSDAAYDLGYCDGISHEQDENRVAKPRPGAPMDLSSNSYVVGL